MGKYRSFDHLVDKMSANLRPRVGIVLRPNRRSQESKDYFKTKFESPFPQWAWVFWVKRHPRSQRPMNQPLKDLIKTMNEKRRSIGIAKAYKLALSDLGLAGDVDVAFEFAIPDVHGTGHIAACAWGEYFMFGNFGVFIRDMTRTFTGEAGKSRREDPDFEEFVQEMPSAVNGVGFVWSDQLKEVCDDFENFTGSTDEPVDQTWAGANRPVAEKRTFRRPRWLKHKLLSRIPTDEKEDFESEVDVEVDKMWRDHRKKVVLTDRRTLEQVRALLGTFKSAYLQMVMDSSSLKVWGRVLTPQYQF